jgi:antitoxin (DNA-binding transcriptional repressor) of toxin-antitoxin stability system
MGKVLAAKAKAKAHSSELVEPAAAGEPVCMAPRGGATATPRKRVNVAPLRAMTDAMPIQPESAGDFIRRMRDDNRY